jgi:hypothetical protein
MVSDERFVSHGHIEGRELFAKTNGLWRGLHTRGIFSPNSIERSAIACNEAAFHLEKKALICPRKTRLWTKVSSTKPIGLSLTGRGTPARVRKPMGGVQGRPAGPLHSRDSEQIGLSSGGRKVV